MKIFKTRIFEDTFQLDKWLNKLEKKYGYVKVQSMVWGNFLRSKVLFVTISYYPKEHWRVELPPAKPSRSID